ncbi:MAG: PPC domain-containing protein [Myxococcota bacterium]
MKSTSIQRAIGSFILLATIACGEAPVDIDADGKKAEPFTSARATLLDFSFEGSVLTNSSWGVQRFVENQLFFTIGQLNGNSSVGRLDRLEITVKATESAGDGLTLVIYDATLPVGWGSKTNLPTSYEFILPKRADVTGQQAFTDKYKDSCVDWSAHDVDAGSMWYYYRPKTSRCQLDEADVVRINAVVTVSDENTTEKYPEYHKVWEDGVLEVVAIFGKNEADATTNSDAGVAAYNTFLRLMKSELGAGVKTTPPDLPSNPGVSIPDVTFEAQRDASHKIKVVVLLIDGVRRAGPGFDARYEALTPTADFVGYYGHSGLGANIRALARKGSYVAGQYQIFFMSGCDTFAYVDSALADAHMAVNPDDIRGTKYLDIVTNVMPAYFSSNASNGRALVRALMSYDAPQTYEEIFTNIDSVQVVVATGEEDNIYVPGYDPGAGDWEGLQRYDSVDNGKMVRVETPELPAGDYLFAIRGDADHPGGDVDLYVRVGAAPTMDTWDCRPYKSGSDEECRLTLDAPAAVHLMIYGFDSGTSHFFLEGQRLGGGTAGPWDGMQANGTVAKDEDVRWTTAVVPAGTYVFEMTGTDDADLYVRIGSAPTLHEFDCRPYQWGSTESCSVSLLREQEIHVMVRGYAASSTFEIRGRSE